ncbi:MAG TPA: hypothetical protein VN442_09085 [Bryobacteraceae bacterium]|nr:hypothetical protein [Bryobacteraceae bacterium]
MLANANPCYRLRRRRLICRVAARPRCPASPSATGAAKVLTDLKLSGDAEISLSPDGKSFATFVNRPRAGIWTLEGFALSRGLFLRYCMIRLHL